MGFGAMLKEAREKAGLTQESLAEKTGLPLRSIQNWEQGHRTPKVHALAGIARALGCSLDSLVLALAKDKLTPDAPKSPRGRKGKK
jgi:transcriptional regulator with XRE-family HTH domain